MKKNIDIVGFTQKQRLEELKRAKEKYTKKGYTFVDYTDNGVTKSFATFEIDEANIKQSSGLFAKILIILFVVIVGWSIFSPSEPLENKTLREATRLSLDELKEYSNSYAKVKELNSEYYNKFYTCISERLWDKSPDLLLGKISEWCYNDTKREDYNNINYIDRASFELYFNKFDGSYTPFVEYIKSEMKNPASFEHVKTLISYRSNTENPHMFIRCIYRGTNSFGGVVEQSISAKVDDKTKNIYDISYE
ncbi:hypothetical protein [Aliarcobacter butzleri]|uniref:hypothetical protein n=1 Tax=Aliarcobacter butzleri TaxID=28197 RepID=UPI00125E9F7C|nr:hypothetical protein [Aliarcobacter butzleri]